jgi:hypothetical protein
VVVRARALSDATRRPRLEVLEVLKGSYGERTLAIVPYFRDYTRPEPWLEREVFAKGEESLLFLQPYVDDHGRSLGPDLFEVMGAAEGKLTLPAEGGVALVDAVRRFVGILALGQHEAQSRALRALLHESNPILLEAGLDECRRFRLVEPEDSAALLPITEHPRPDFRSGALALLGILVREAALHAPPGAPPQISGIFDRVAAAARLDAEVMVRREAVVALEALATPEALAILDSIGTSDASQQVRYAAQVAAHRLRSTAPVTPD